MPGEKRSFKSVRDTRSLKFLGCIKYIKYCAEVYSETCGNIRFVPHKNPTQFYQDYVDFHDNFGLTKAKSDTFRKALDSLYDSIRLVHAKGWFPTCNTCNNANDMLSESQLQSRISWHCHEIQTSSSYEANGEISIKPNQRLKVINLYVMRFFNSTQIIYIQNPETNTLNHN